MPGMMGGGYPTDPTSYAPKSDGKGPTKPIALPQDPYGE